MGADGSKFSRAGGGGGGIDAVDGTETDYSSSRRAPTISTRSQSVPVGSAAGADEDDIFDDNMTVNHSKDPLQRHRSSTMVVVNRGQSASTSDVISQDPLLKKLEELHFFYPLMHDVERRSGLFGTHNRKALAEIQSKVNYLPALKIVRIYEDRLRKHTDAVSAKQRELSGSIKQADLMVTSLLKSYSERAKVTAKYVDRLTKLDDLKRSMNRCHETFNECLAIIDLLDEMLPEDERLEEFEPWEEEEPDEEASECIANS